ncbi:MAG: 30S ribosomal protein S8 [Candidatus Levybacteria bacterium GW2011_GWA2_40_8]|nr:MAG: 30S ribosomal protein S8 [Candidatus Levybacteria bacterium GW2011_GWA2_40_8]
MANRRELTLPFSKINKNVGKLLVKEGFLEDLKEEKEKDRKFLRAVLKYERRIPSFSNVLVVSKPSLRVYKSAKSIEGIQRRGRHTVVLSTSLGIMTGKEAQKKGVGGEILFEIW